MSRHSKNNTARGHFTYAEKQMLDYGTKKEIERQVKMSEYQRKHEEQEQLLKEDLAQQIILSEFEKNQMGVLSKTKALRGKLTNDISLADSPSSSFTFSANGTSSSENRKKRPFELDAAEIERASKQERQSVAKAIEEEAKLKKPVLPSFWVPSLTPSTGGNSESKPTKAHPVCTATEDVHKLSLKQLITVRFETAVEDHDEAEAKYAKISSICPICRKGFTNTSRISILKSCGHVFCDNCCKQFVNKSSRCQTCGHKTKEKEIIGLRGEGSGFSGGGAKEASKFDVAFQ
ncbi:hypothetical protein BGZ65_002784 [Modicella reniformis]|uniref:RING-type domain-containing protein n=1 Tax=Modicella reniformis TaxID=1440133 RepID=A0A9P6STZ1_9FUNG|nr:hypothetical protein BGZ65_002784 [Modicella reniformis]